MEGTVRKSRRPPPGEVLEAEVPATYFGWRRGTFVPYRDHITVFNRFGEERFDLVRVAQGVCWQRTCLSASTGVEERLT